MTANSISRTLSIKLNIFIIVSKLLKLFKKMFIYTNFLKKMVKNCSLNYRLLILTLILFKLLEKYRKNRLLEFLDNMISFIKINYFGFRNNLSTNNASN